MGAEQDVWSLAQGVFRRERFLRKRVHGGAGVVELSVDETSVRRGHEYVTVVCEPGTYGTPHPTRVLAVTEGKDAEAQGQARRVLQERGLDPERVQEVCADMSPAYAKGVAQEFPNARLVFDYFLVVGLLTSAVDKVRRRESVRFPELLKGTRYLWLKNEENLTEDQRGRRRQLCRCKLQTAKAYSPGQNTCVSKQIGNSFGDSSKFDFKQHCLRQKETMLYRRRWH